MSDTAFSVEFVSSAQFDFQTGAVPQVQRLLEIHSLIGGVGRGRRYNLDVVNKSAVVLTCAYWEAFVEDLAAETLLHFAEHATSPSVLPTPLKKSLIKDLQRTKNELAPWDLADDGWRKQLQERAARIRHEDDRTLSYRVQLRLATSSATPLVSTT